MSDVIVKVRAKGCANTGITEDVGKKLYKHKGSKMLAIVEFNVEETAEKADGDRKVFLTIDTLEPVVADDLETEHKAEDHIREFLAALYYNRAKGDQGTIPYGDGQPGDRVEPTVPGVLAAGLGLVDKDDDGKVVGLFSHKAEKLLEEQAAAAECPGDGCPGCPGCTADADDETPSENEKWPDGEPADVSTEDLEAQADALIAEADEQLTDQPVDDPGQAAVEVPTEQDPFADERPVTDIAEAGQEAVVDPSA